MEQASSSTFVERLTNELARLSLPEECQDKIEAKLVQHSIDSLTDHIEGLLTYVEVKKEELQAQNPDSQRLATRTKKLGKLTRAYESISQTTSKFPDFHAECETMVRRAQILTYFSQIEVYLALIESTGSSRQSSDKTPDQSSSKPQTKDKDLEGRQTNEQVMYREQIRRRALHIRDAHNNAFSAFDYFFGKYYSPWAEQAQIKLATESGPVADALRQMVMKAALNFRDTETNCGTYKKILLAEGALFGPSASGGAEEVRLMLQHEVDSQTSAGTGTTSDSDTPFDSLLKSVKEDEWLFGTWKALMSFNDMIQNKETLQHLRWYLKVHVDGSIILVQKPVSRSGGKKRKQSVDELHANKGTSGTGGPSKSKIQKPE